MNMCNVYRKNILHNCVCLFLNYQEDSEKAQQKTKR